MCTHFIKKSGEMGREQTKKGLLGYSQRGAERSVPPSSVSRGHIMSAYFSNSSSQKRDSSAQAQGSCCCSTVCSDGAAH